MHTVSGSIDCLRVSNCEVRFCFMSFLKHGYSLYEGGQNTFSNQSSGERGQIDWPHSVLSQVVVNVV